MHGVHGELTSFEDESGLSLVNDGRSEETKPTVTVFEVVPGKEILEKSLGVKQALETLWKGRSILQRLELSLRKGIVVAHVRSAVALGYPEVGQQVSDLFGCHARPPVGVQRQFIGFDLVATTAC